MADKIQLRRDLAANWTSANPILAQGEEGHELDTAKRKIGDGVTTWNSLPYIFNAATETVTTVVEAPAGTFTYTSEDSTVTVWTVGGGGSSDHGALTGLGDDDHTQYLNETRHDTLPSDNPHSVTATQIGLGNVDNTSDLNKPISTDVQTALDLKYDNSNPNGYETPAELSIRDTANRNRANHTGTQIANTISDFSTAVRAVILTGLSLVSNAAITAADSVLSAIGKLQSQITSFATEFYIEDTTGLINDGTTFTTYLTLNFTAEAADYVVDIGYIWSGNDAANDFRGRFLINGTAVIPDHRQEPKDPAGTGVVLPLVGGGTLNSGTNQRHCFNYKKRITATAGAQTVEIQLSCAANGDRAAIYEAYISVRKVL